MILNRINFVRIDLVIIDFEVKYLCFVVPLKMIMIKSKKIPLLPKSILEARIDSRSEKSNIIKNC